VTDELIAEAAAVLWALLHNGRSPEGYWDGETQRYYRRVVALFVTDPTVHRLIDSASPVRSC